MRVRFPSRRRLTLWLVAAIRKPRGVVVVCHGYLVIAVGPGVAGHLHARLSVCYSISRVGVSQGSLCTIGACKSRNALGAAIRGAARLPIALFGSSWAPRFDHDRAREARGAVIADRPTRRWPAPPTKWWISGLGKGSQPVPSHELVAALMRRPDLQGVPLNEVGEIARAAAAAARRARLHPPIAHSRALYRRRRTRTLWTRPAPPTSGPAPTTVSFTARHAFSGRVG